MRTAAIIFFSTLATLFATTANAGSFGQTSLRAGFSPDPHVQPLTAGGGNRASNWGSSCRGYIASQPDYTLYYTAGSMPLYINADSDRDTTLVVRAPDGRIYCDDDGADAPLNPRLIWNRPMSGQYQIWVGTYSSGSGVPAWLFISELREYTRATAGNSYGGGSNSSGVNHNATPTYGAITLNANFMPDPYTVGVVAGGELRASNAVPGSCYGYITHAPTMQVTYNGGRSLYFYTNGSTDTTLAIRDAQGNWRCSDDELDTDAGLGYRNATRGTYDVWVGTYGSTRGNTQLMVSEISMGYGR